MSRNRNEKRKVAFYGRVSTEHEAQLDALENQMQWYDDQLKYNKNWTLVERYIDKGITGTQAKKRPAFLKMMEDAKKEKFDLVVTREVCRFARNTVDALNYTRGLKKIDVEVYFVEDNIWTMDNDGELRLTIMATLAQDESRKVSERVKAGQKVSRANGILYGNGNILGYNRMNRTYIIDEEQAETVRIIYKLYIKGLGEKKIMNELCRLHRKDAFGNVKWSVSKINRILRNSTYKGYMAYGKSHSNNYLEQIRINNHDSTTYTYVKGDFEPIINEEDWNKVQEVRKSKTLQINVDGKNKTKGKRKTEDVWLRKLRCSCGSSFRKNKWRTNKKTEEVVYGYQCYNQVNNGSKRFRENNGLDTEGYCSIRMVGDWKLDLMAKVILESIWKNRKEAVVKAYKMISENYITDDEAIGKTTSKTDKIVLQNRIQKTENQIDSLICMRADGDITKDEYNRLKSKLDMQLQSLNSDLSSSEKVIIDKDGIKKKLEEIKQVLGECIDFNKPKIDEDVLERFIKQVTPLDNSLFRWSINFLGDDKNELICGIDGRKSNPEFIDGEGKHLPINQSSSGCIESKEIVEISTFSRD